MPIRTFLLPLIAAATLALVTASAWAQDGRGGRQGRQGGDRDQAGMRDDARMARPLIVAPRPEPQSRRSRRDDALADSVRRIERSTRGQVISAERMQSDGRDINRIKVMDERGRVRVYMDDPQQRRRSSTRDDDN